MTPEQWADSVSPNFRKWLRLVIDNLVGKNCDGPFIVRQYLTILRDQWGMPHESESTSETAKEEYGSKISDGPFNMRDF